MATTFLNVLHGFLAPDTPYDQLPPLVYFELGFTTGIAYVSLEIQMNQTMGDPLVKNFIQLCEGQMKVNEEILSYRESPIDGLDTLHGTVSFGAHLAKIGACAATQTGQLVCKTISNKPEMIGAGAVVMLPLDSANDTFNSVFYIATKDQTIYEGEVIGHVEKGLGQLKKLLREFGSYYGKPQKRVTVHDCGQI